MMANHRPDARACRNAARLGGLVLLSACCLLGTARGARAEVLVRWDQDQVPSPRSLGITTLVVPAENKTLVANALAQGYRLFLQVNATTRPRLSLPPGQLAGLVVPATVGQKERTLLHQQLRSRGARLLVLEERGKWPHIRTNWVTRNKDVLQVTSRSSQPWIENNAALLRIARASGSGRAPLLTYPWKPITLADEDAGPSLDDYLVAIAEAGSFGGDLLLPLHPRMQQNLLLAQPGARADWRQLLESIEFYSWNVLARHEPMSNVALVTREPTASFEVMNLLLRHNLPVEVVAPQHLSSRPLAGYDLLIAPEALNAAELETVAAFVEGGGAAVVTGASTTGRWRTGTPVARTDGRARYEWGKGTVLEVSNGIADPNAFALEMRQLLGPDRRVIDIWNGITVMTSPYRAADGTVLVTVLNYAHQPLPVQLRMRGRFAAVHFEAPGEAAALLPYQHRNGYTEFVVPALRVGGRVFLSERQDAPGGRPQ